MVKSEIPPEIEEKTISIGIEDMESLSPSVERAKRLIKDCKNNYDCFIQIDLCGLFALSSELDKLIEAGQTQTENEVLKFVENIRWICARLQLKDSSFELEDIYRECNEKIEELKAGVQDISRNDGKED